MVRISEDLIRKRAEHNNLEISTLEEVSLHQQDIERIEFIDKWCRELKILYLQSNLISKIENVGRLKKLEYLNLALNNIERIENLSGCECLKKLDLTVNFVGELTSIETLKDNVYLEEVYLTGNPCADFDGYREYVVATLPNLKRLDGREIGRSERIQAVQSLDAIKPQIFEQQEEYRFKREKEKLASEQSTNLKTLKKEGKDGRWYTDINEGDKTPETESKEVKDADDEFWNETVEYTPESRKAIHDHLRESREKQEQKRTPGELQEKRKVRLVTDDGKVLNVNEAKVDFKLTDEEEENSLKLEVACYKHLDTSLLDVDVQPTHVLVNIKGKVLQLVLPEEVKPDSSNAKRSQTTGHLLITMPKVRDRPISVAKPRSFQNDQVKGNKANYERERKDEHSTLLEVDPNSCKHVDLMITCKEKKTRPQQPKGQGKPVSDGFVDDPDVPPLE